MVPVPVAGMSILSDLAVSVISTVVAAGTWAGLLFLINAVRNFRLEHRLRNSFQQPGYSFGIDTFGVTLTNKTKERVKVWEVAIYDAESGSIILNYSGEKRVERHTTVEIPNTGETVDTTISMFPFESEAEEGAVELDFDMSAKWELPNRYVVKWLKNPKVGFCLIEYKTLIGTRKRLKVTFRRPKELQNCIRNHRNDCLEEPKKMHVNEVN